MLQKYFALGSSLHKVTVGLAPKFGGPFRGVNAYSDQVYELETLSGKCVGKLHSKDLKVFCSILTLE